MDESEPTISAWDLGLLRGYAVFDFFVTYNKKPFKLDEHIERLSSSAQAINLDIPYPKQEIKDKVFRIINANQNLKELAIKIVVTGGLSSDGFYPDGKSNLIILAEERHTLAQKFYEDGIAIKTDDFIRHLPQAKTNNYIEAIRTVRQARKEGFYDVLYVYEARVLELTRSNIFAVIGNTLLTPKSNILKGITRKVLLEILKLDIPIKESDFNLDQLLGASEAFLTASNSEIMPITKMNNSTIGDGKVGNITKEVMRQFKEYTLSDRW